jgi:hypothetical protein
MVFSVLKRRKAQKEEGMKTLFWLGGLVWAFGLAQTVQAIPVASTVSVTDGAKLEAYGPAKADLTALAAAIHATQVANLNANRLLGSIVPAHNVAQGGGGSGTPDYTPVTVIRNPNLNDPNISTRRPFSPQPSPSTRSANPLSVPDGGTTAGLLGMALGSAVLMKKMSLDRKTRSC